MAQLLHHEHIVRINDPANVAGAWLTREQLWAGLHHTVVAPELLDETIDSASVYHSLDIERIREVRRFVGQALA
jgi:hypothetical protein